MDCAWTEWRYYVRLVEVINAIIRIFVLLSTTYVVKLLVPKPMPSTTIFHCCAAWKRQGAGCRFGKKAKII